MKEWNKGKWYHNDGVQCRDFLKGKCDRVHYRKRQLGNIASTNKMKDMADLFTKIAKHIDNCSDESCHVFHVLETHFVSSSTKDKER